MKRHLATACVSFQILGYSIASTATSLGEYIVYERDPDAPRVSVQVCLPNRTAFFDAISVDVTEMPENVDDLQVRKLFHSARQMAPVDASTAKAGQRVYQSIREWRAPTTNTEYPQPGITAGTTYHHGEVWSDNKEFALLFDATERDQPVYYLFTNARSKDIVAFHVTLAVMRSGTGEQTKTFWFRAPNGIVRGSYTNWIAPASEETVGRGPSVTALLTHGNEMPRYEVGENAPRARFSLMSLKDDIASSKRVLRARYAAQLERAKVGRPYAPTEGVMFVADRRDRIPPCNE